VSYIFFVEQLKFGFVIKKKYFGKIIFEIKSP